MRTQPAPPPDDPAAGPPADPEAVARTICLRLLTARPRTRAELAKALRARRVPDDAATAVLDRLGEVGLVDDDAFAAAWVSSRHVGRGLGRRALAAELRSHGVAAPTVSAAIAGLDPEAEVETARRLVRRRLAALSTAPADVRLRRLLGLLARKGYPPDVATRVVREALADSAGDAQAAALDAMSEGR